MAVTFDELVAKIDSEIESIKERGKHQYYNFEIDCGNNRAEMNKKLKSYYENLGYTIRIDNCSTRKNKIRELMISF